MRHGTGARSANCLLTVMACTALWPLVVEYSVGQSTECMRRAGHLLRSQCKAGPQPAIASGSELCADSHALDMKIKRRTFTWHGKCRVARATPLAEACGTEMVSVDQRMQEPVSLDMTSLLRRRDRICPRNAGCESATGPGAAACTTQRAECTKPPLSAARRCALAVQYMRQ